MELTDYEVTATTATDASPAELLVAAEPATGATTDGGAVPAAAPPATPHTLSFPVNAKPRATGIGFNKFGDAINLAELPDEDSNVVKAPQGYVEVIAEFDALPILVAAGEIAMVGKLAPSATGAKAMNLLRSGERLSVATEYSAIVERLAQSGGAE